MADGVRFKLTVELPLRQFSRLRSAAHHNAASGNNKEIKRAQRTPFRGKSRYFAMIHERMSRQCPMICLGFDYAAHTIIQQCALDEILVLRVGGGDFGLGGAELGLGEIDNGILA